MKGNVIVGQSGGPTAAINASLAGVYRTAKDRGANKVYGMLHGIQGLLKEKYIDLSDHIKTELDAELLKRTPAAFLGSCRYKLPEIHENREVYDKIFEILDMLRQINLENVLVDYGHIVKITQGIYQNRHQTMVDLKGHNFCCTLSQKLRQGTNTWANFDDINLVINLSRIHDFLKNIGIRQEILPEGLFKGKTVTLQHCLGHAIICNSHLFSFLLSVTTIVTHSPCILGSA